MVFLEFLIERSKHAFSCTASEMKYILTYLIQESALAISSVGEEEAVGEGLDSDVLGTDEPQASNRSYLSRSCLQLTWPHSNKDP
jgi:hypothetical protein